MKKCKEPLKFERPEEVCIVLHNILWAGLCIRLCANSNFARLHLEMKLDNLWWSHQRVFNIL
jgi:hypothetical protein